MPGGTGILILNVDNLLGRSFFCTSGLFLYFCVCLPSNLSVSLFFIGADSERAAGSGDKKTTGLFQSDATTWCVGRDPVVTYVAPLASSFTVPLAASQQHYVTSYVHIWKHTQTHS